MDTAGNSLALVALTGLMGAPHCFAMCGGIVSSVALRAQGSPMALILAYNVGRVATYAAIGGFMGLVGSFLDSAAGFVGLQSAASIIGGLLILLWTFRRYTLPMFRTHPYKNSRVQSKLQQLGQRYEILATFLTGILLGFLPCGLTYAMHMNAAASGTAAEGSLIMLVFGISTFPVLLLTAMSAGSLTKRWRRAMRRIGGYLAVLMGLLCILKGLSANGWIPSVHPWLW
ncbi:sulfite exporter TauE/SafE [Paenibacillus lactis]|uniref:Sulfite exporter TauE/SafE n=2 Tax=Paenibacillus lactis TaxID=228574 RepID=A0ABS4FCW6_9BACL|nr:sulfite exporter TauE/SafE family protein [Paenibacillus lactis]MBP1894089.1 sulfite exporter TauE/SafE [Paenibacillus lactis]